MSKSLVQFPINVGSTVEDNTRSTHPREEYRMADELDLPLKDEIPLRILYER